MAAQSMSITPEKAAATTFEDAASASLSRLRAVFGEMVASLPSDVRSAASLQKALKIDSKLSWQIFKIANSPEPLAAGTHVPTPATFSRLLKAASRQEVSASVLDSMSSAYEEFELLIKTHAGDRHSLEMMIAGCVDQNITHVEMTHRKAAFRANSYLYGLQARTQLKATFWGEGSEAGTFDAVGVHGLLGLRRIRSYKSWVISRGLFHNADGTIRYPAILPLEGGLDPVEGVQQVPLLKEFCSTPIPEIRRVTTPDGFLVDTLFEGPIGNRGAIDFMTAEVVRNAGIRTEESMNIIAQVRTPCEVLIIDQFILEGLWGPLDPELRVFNCQVESTETYGLDDGGRTRVPVHETVQYLGKGTDVIHTADVPRNKNIAKYVFDRMGWDGKRFDVFRIRMEFPFVPTSVVFHQKMHNPDES